MMTRWLLSVALTATFSTMALAQEAPVEETTTETPAEATTETPAEATTETPAEATTETPAEATTETSPVMVPLPSAGAATPIEVEPEEASWDPLRIEADDGWYVRLLKSEIVRIGDMDLFGNSAQLPRGYLSIKYDWTTTRAGSRFDSTGKRGPVMEPISLTQGETEVINVDLGMSGEGGGHGFMVSYGITDPLDWFLELPFTYMTLKLAPQVSAIDEDGNRIEPAFGGGLGITNPTEYNAADFIYHTLPMTGRPSPPTGYEGAWLLGDIRTGFSWNYFRDPRMSFALVPKIGFPTGKVQNPNNSVLYGTGPAIETGLGGWAVGLSHVLDVRLFRLPPWLDVILTTELGVGFGFPQERDYPTKFTVPDERIASLDRDLFPDLSNLEGTFSYTPGFSLDWMAQLSIGAPLLSLGFAYGIQFSQMPWMEGDPDFIRMARAFELVGQSELHAVQVGVTTSLLPLYIPIGIGFSYRHAIAGRNIIVLEDYYQISITGIVPIEPLMTFESEDAE